MTTDKNREILATQVGQVYRYQPIGFIANMVNSAILVFIQWKAVSHRVLLIWFGAMIVVTGLRYLFILRYKHADVAPAQSPRWEALFIGGVLISGSIWGVAGILFFPPGDLARQIFTAFVLGGMVAGAVGVYSALKRAFLAFTLPALIPVAISFFYIGDAVHFTMGAMVILFAILMFMTAERNYKINVTSLELTLENKDLVTYLTAAKEETDSLNMKLRSEIAERKMVSEELEKHRGRLEVLVKERTDDLRRANEELEEAVVELKQTTVALRDSEEKYRMLVNNANDAVFIAQDGVIKFPNPMFKQATGYSTEEASAMPLENLIHPDDRALVGERYLKRLRGEDVPGIYSFRIITKSGEERSVSINAVRIIWEGRPAALYFARDITETIKLEKRLQTAQKMEAVGILAGGVAHDFNNLLMSIQGNISLLLHDLDPDHPSREMLSEVEQSIESGEQLTRQLLGFARGGKYELSTIDLNEIVSRTASLFGRTKKEIRIHQKLQEGLRAAEADRSQIEQVLLNLYINAGQAMPGGGELYLETENVDFPTAEASVHGIEPGRYVKISVTDTGAGIKKEHLEKIFDPFFTTREKTRGIGLGLASSYGIIQNHHGTITIRSEIEHGTTFNIYLPVSEKKARTKKPASETISPGSGTVLLVDDEERIIRPVMRYLQYIGFEVIPAGGGEEALRIYREKGETVDIVMLDMVMPGLSGGKTYDVLREINPDVKVLLCSGYSADGEAARILKSGRHGFIQKPFTTEQLSRKLEEILHPPVPMDE